MSPGVLIALGLTSEHLVRTAGGALMDERAAEAFLKLQSRAEKAGFKLSIASGFRSYQRQLTIFNDKWSGERPVLDDNNAVLVREDHTDEDWLHRILRFSALPGTSRHHWGTDIDIYDPSLMPDDYSLQLTASEYRTGGIFEYLSQWLDGVIADDDSEGFYRPYDCDRGGVSVEPWHLSFSPVASKSRAALTPDSLRDLWSHHPDLRPKGYEVLVRELDNLMARYVV